MKSVSIFLNFPGNTAEVFAFYKSIFKTEYANYMTFKDMPSEKPLPSGAENQIMHVASPIGGGIVLMGADAPPQMGYSVNLGNNFYINLGVESEEEATYYFNALSQNGKIEMDLQHTFWGAFFGSFSDKFGIPWMVNFERK